MLGKAERTYISNTNPLVTSGLLLLSDCTKIKLGIKLEDVVCCVGVYVGGLIKVPPAVWTRDSPTTPDLTPSTVY